MRKFLLLILFVSSLFAKEIIAVIELEQKGLTKQEAEILTDRLTTKLVSIGKYQVVERNNMDKILKEQKFQHSGCTDSECAVEIGQLLNTDLIVIGSVSKFGTTWALDARLIDVGQGNVLISAEFTMTGAIDGLITTGITSVSRQLCELEGVPTPNFNVQQQTKPNIINNVLKDIKSIEYRSDISDKKSSIGIGLTNKTFNLIQYTYDLKLSKNIAIYSVLGIGNIGLGLAWQSNYNDNGWMVGWSGGQDLQGEPFGCFSVSYQWRLGNKPYFISLGISNYSWMQKHSTNVGGNYTSWHERKTSIVPIISLDRRFNFPKLW